jgi:hypothetical protein
VKSLGEPSKVTRELGGLATNFAPNISDPFFCFDVRGALCNPQLDMSNKVLRDYAWDVYNASGTVGATIDYLVNLYNLDHIIATDDSDFAKDQSFDKYKKIVKRFLKDCKFKKLVRDFLLKDFNDGTSVYYWDVAAQPIAVETNSVTQAKAIGQGLGIVPLPVDYCKVLAARNGTYTVQFDTTYFSENPDAIAGYPSIIVSAFQTSGVGWVTLPSSHTIVCKARTKAEYPWGIPYITRAADELEFYGDVLKAKNTAYTAYLSNVYYGTVPDDPTDKSAATDEQVQAVHDVASNLVKATTQKGTNYATFRHGFQINSIEPNLKILDEELNSNPEAVVAMALGISPALIGSATSANYATANLNLNLLANMVYSRIEEFMEEFNKCLNYVLLGFDYIKLEVSIVKTSFINQTDLFSRLQQMYTSSKGSLQALIAASGISTDEYIAMLEYEKANDWESKFPVHATSYTQSTEVVEGESSTKPTSYESEVTTNNDANAMPSPSDV